MTDNDKIKNLFGNNDDSWEESIITIGSLNLNDEDDSKD